MLIEIKVPGVGESVTEALLAQWFKNDGDLVKKDEPLFVIETDKVTLEVVAEADGVLSIKVSEGETVAIGAVVGTLDTAAAVPKAAPAAAAPEAVEAQEVKPSPPETAKRSGTSGICPRGSATDTTRTAFHSRGPRRSYIRRSTISAIRAKAGCGKGPESRFDTGYRP
jgi:2-oxoglutarate dehydrogenase E2 component (dihydrolipoamide succinyltransferase)